MRRVGVGNTDIDAPLATFAPWRIGHGDFRPIRCDQRIGWICD
jgi:hypothetical protein